LTPPQTTITGVGLRPEVRLMRDVSDIAYSDRSSLTAHRVPQTAAEADHPRAQRSPWLVEVCHIRGRTARGLQRSGRSRSLPSALNVPARPWPLAHIGAPVPALRREPWDGGSADCRALCLWTWAHLVQFLAATGGRPNDLIPACPFRPFPTAGVDD
jgi:hypothetical protein